jgi:ATP-binding protein involved in chromosome partitioning
VAVRVASMGRNSYLRVAGVIENMSAFVDEDGKTHEVFGVGGGEDLAEQIDAPLVGKIPLDRAVVDGGDTGTPAVLGGGAAADALRKLAHLVSTELIPPIDMAGCSTRIIDQALANLEAMDAAEQADAAS